MSDVKEVFKAITEDGEYYVVADKSESSGFRKATEEEAKLWLLQQLREENSKN